MNMDEAKPDKKSPSSKKPSDECLPNYKISDIRHKLSLSGDLISDIERNEAKDLFLEKVKEDGMLPQYLEFCRLFGWQIDDSLVKSLEEANTTELSALDTDISNAEENYGDLELRDALTAKANFYCRTGDDKAAVESYAKAYEKTIGAGGRLDIIQTVIRLGLCRGNLKLVHQNIARAKKELERGGDWERINKLKMLEALHLMNIRQFSEAAQLFLAGTATFNATEILSFETFIFYTVILSLLTLERPVLKQKLISNPEILQVIAEDEPLRQFLFSYYNCDYRLFMNQLICISSRVKVDKYLGRHYLYFVRNIRLRAYQQFLEPYKSVTLKSMGDAFGVSETFIEQEVFDFIGGSRLNCKINTVKGIIESSRSDSCDSLYNRILEEGDALLNRVQKLARVINA